MNILQKLLNNDNGIHFLWTGNDGWLIWDGKILLGIDLDLYNPDRINPPIIDINLLKEKIDIMLFTHAHEDHFNTPTLKKLINSKCQYIVPKSCQSKMIDFRIDKRQIYYVEPKDELNILDISIECIKALHGHKNGTIYRNASMQDCGYILNINKKRFYHPGDTVILEEHFNIKNIDILFIAPTEHNTHINNSLWLVQQLHPKYTIAQHFGTYQENERNNFWTHGYVHELEPLLNNITNYIIPNENNILSISTE